VLGSPNDDLIDARGLSVSTALVGGSGNDTLYGSSVRNLLIGGVGTDTLFAGAGDILIGGSTSFDSDPTALASVLVEWGRTDVDYSTRVKHLNGGFSGGLNGLYLFNSATVTDDGAVDVLNGGAGLDWYIGHFSGKTPDKVNGQASGETATSI
jgi:Ca2+-binding RTX toxin-like protein